MPSARTGESTLSIKPLKVLKRRDISRTTPGKTWFQVKAASPQSQNTRLNRTRLSHCRDVIQCRLAANGILIDINLPARCNFTVHSRYRADPIRFSLSAGGKLPAFFHLSALRWNVNVCKCAPHLTCTRLGRNAEKSFRRHGREGWPWRRRR